MAKTAHSIDDVFKAIETLNREVEQEPELVNRLGLAHAFYVSGSDESRPLFGFSKFVGWRGLSAADYLNQYNNLDGRDTERLLSEWFEEVKPGSRAYNRLFDHLCSWLSKYGKRPRGGGQKTIRIMVPRPGLNENARASDDRRLLNLMIAAADLLSTEHRHLLRATL